MKFQVALLQRRLPETHALKADLAALGARSKRHADGLWRDGSTELSDLKQCFSTLKRSSVPQSLHYILSNLDCLMSLSAEAAPKHVSVETPSSTPLQQ